MPRPGYSTRLGTLFGGEARGQILNELCSIEDWVRESELVLSTGLDRKTVSVILGNLRKQLPDLIETKSPFKGVRVYRVRKESRATELLTSLISEVKRGAK